MIREPSGTITAKVLPDSPFFDLIEEAYRVFAYPKPTNIEVCTGCCMDADIEADFFNPAIRELPLHYIQDWYFAAYNPNGITKETWAYLLPRILEILAANEDVSNVGTEVSLNRFATGNPNNWSKQEWQILDNFQRMYLKYGIETANDFLDDAICMFSLARWSLDDLLDQIASVPDEILAQRFWRDWCKWPAPGNESVWITAFWENAEKSLVHNFYTSREMYHRMMALALADNTNADIAAKAIAVAKVMDASAG